MTTSQLDINGDWTFGQGLANYIRQSREVRQNLVTRIKSFQNDWFLDSKANIDWFNILGNKNNEEIIIRDIERVTSETTGVKTVDSIEVAVNRETRSAFIQLRYTDIYDPSFLRDLGLEVTNGA